ncbi:MAG TPA: copper-binding protein [Pyrinomonadaceae bacterium]
MKRRTKIYIIFILISTISACRQKAAENTNQAIKPAQTTSATPNASPSIPVNKSYEGRGVVTKINLELVSVELKHEKIEGLMNAMTMEFYVAKKSELEKLKIGDAVEFVIDYKNGQEKISSIQKSK